MINKSHKFIILAMVIFLLGISYFLWFQVMPTQKFHDIEGLLWPKVKAITDFQLVNHRNEPFNRESLLGAWSLMFFGYTHCPDICPTTLLVLKEVKAQIAQSTEYGSDTQYIFVSVDGERDTPEKLAEYIHYFDPGFIGATGTTSQVNVLTRQLGIVYIRKPSQTAGQYFIDHSSAILLVNPQGEMVGQFSAPHLAQTIVSQYSKMRQFLLEQS
jgi:protein SCO1/2